MTKKGHPNCSVVNFVGFNKCKGLPLVGVSFNGVITIVPGGLSSLGLVVSGVFCGVVTSLGPTLESSVILSSLNEVSASVDMSRSGPEVLFFFPTAKRWTLSCNRVRNWHGLL